jgi:predicted dehydrogenase
MAASVRLGLIGAGSNMQGAHVPRHVDNPASQIVAVTEPFAPNVERLHERFPALAGVPVFTDHDSMLGSVQLDAVIISTPHSFHFQQIMDALDAGKHVLCEKPLVNSVKEALAVIKKRDETGKVVLVSYQRHYQHAFLLMKKAIDSGLIGALQFVQLQQNQNWYAGQKRANRWRSNKELSGGGQLNDSGSHIVDILLYITGLIPERVYATQQNFDLGIDINSAVTVSFQSGATGNLSIVGNAPFPGASVHEDISIYGSEGAVFYRQVGQQDPRRPFIQVRRFDSNDPVEVHDVPAESTPDANFIATILGKVPNMAPAECGLRVMELSEAAWKSAESGQPVDVGALR